MGYTILEGFMSSIAEKIEEFSEEEEVQAAYIEGEVFEVINGKMSSKGFPSEEHQAIVGEIYKQISIYLEDKPCKVFVSPFPLRVRDYSNIIPFKQDVCSPDVVVMCHKDNQIESKRFPEFVIEVASPSTCYNDLTDKLRIYESIGVKEYWTVIDYSYVLVHLFEANQIKAYRDISGKLIIPVTIFSDLSIVLDKVQIFK